MSKEVTRIITIQLTKIQLLDDNHELISSETAKDTCIEAMKKLSCDLDKIDVTVQDFEFDK